MYNFKAEIRKLKPEGAKIFLEAECKADFQGKIRRTNEIGAVYFNGRCNLIDEPFKYLWESGRCYTQGYYLATISLCSATVELTWNLDPRLHNVGALRRDRNGWITLNRGNLVECQNQGLPVEKLLEPSEMSQMPNLTSNPKFIDIRNKIAHGNVSAYFGGGQLPHYSTKAEDDARSQITKSDEYFVEWANQVCT